MISRFCVASLICASLALAAPATMPTSQPTPSPRPFKTGARLRSTTAPTTSPTTAQAGKFPTPAELLKKMNDMKQHEKSLPKVGYFDLTHPVVEKTAGFSLFGDNDMITLRVLLERMRQARDDKDLRGVLFVVGETGLSLSQAQEIRDALSDIRKAGKRAYVYADSYDTVSYTLASGASDICMLEGGEILIPGVGIETTFAKGLLDKVGVKADYVQIGEYKGADEQFTRTGPSDELRGELNRLMDAMYDQIIDGLSVRRNLSRENVKQLVDDAMVTGKNAKERGLVDHLIDQDGLRDLIAKDLGKEINLVHDYGRAERPDVDLSNPWNLFTMMARKPETSDKPAVAIIYADGVIVDGEGGEGVFSKGGNVGSDDMRRALRTALRDDKIKAVVLRINSPGGSALASEAMWQAARRLGAKKPLIISVGGMAASGGYYLASAGETIFADPSAIVGSIGVVGGKFVLKDLFDKLGITTEAFRRGNNADLFSSTQPFTDRQRTMVTNWMKQTYEQFTERVMTTRQGKIKNIDAVARGRIFMAKQAKDLGMVDELGGLDAALAHAARKVNLEPGTYDVRILPAPKTLADLISGRESDASTPLRAQSAAMQIAESSLLRALSPSMRAALGQQIQILQILQDRPVMLVSPYVITVK